MTLVQILKRLDGVDALNAESAVDAVTSPA
jgi:hypothetical protein